MADAKASARTPLGTLMDDARGYGERYSPSALWFRAAAGGRPSRRIRLRVPVRGIDAVLDIYPSLDAAQIT